MKEALSQDPARFTITVQESGLRLDRYLSQAAGIARGKIKRAIEESNCTINDVACVDPDYRLKTGDRIRLIGREAAASALKPEEGAVDILFQDEYLAVLNKEPDLTVHPCPSSPDGTLVNRLLTHFAGLARLEGPRPGIVHRLDKDTSGLLVIALREDIRLKLGRAFAERQVDKTYLALVRGVPAEAGAVNKAIGRHATLKTKMAILPESKGGRTASSQWQVLYADRQQRFALLAVTIHTGRTHQIRVHLADAGHPLWGDKVYGPSDPADPAPRQLLHAWKLGFAHPATGREMSFTQTPPQDFPETILLLSDKTQRLILTGTPGCGKSAVLQIFAASNIPVWSADKTVAALYEPQGDAWLMLKGRFGNRFVPDENQAVDKKTLGRAIMDEPRLKNELESMVHPMVQASMHDFFARAEKHGNPLAIAEVPLWFESRFSDAQTDSAVATVACPQPIRFARLRKNRGWDDAKISAMEAWQWSEEAKLKASDFRLDNSGSLEELALAAHNLLEELRDKRTRQKQALLSKLQKLWQN